MERTAAWYEANQRVLAAGVGAVREVLELVARDPADPTAGTLVDSALRTAETEMPSRSSLSEIVERFQLSAFERDLLILCAGIELDAGLATAWRDAVGRPGPAYPTFSTALEVLPNAHWSAMTPGSVLRRACLVMLGEGATLGERPLRIAEPVLHFLNGLPELDPGLDGIIAPHREPLPLVHFQRLDSDRIVRALETARAAGDAWPVVAITTGDRMAALAVAAQAAAGMGAALCRLSPNSLPSDDRAIAGLIDLWDRDSILLSAGLFVDLGSERDPARRRLVLRALNRQRGLVFVASPSADDLGLLRKTHRFELRAFAADDRRALWHGFLGNDAPADGRAIEAVSETCPLDATAIAEIAGELRFRAAGEEAQDGSNFLRARCLQRVRASLDPMAERIETASSWDDLVLPSPQLDVLRSVAAQIRNRPKISRLWSPKGAADGHPPVLLVGERGTGKTLAASVIASQLGRDLYRIDAADLLALGTRSAGSRIREILRAADGASVILLVELAEGLLVSRGMETAEPGLARARTLLDLVGPVPVVFETRESEPLPSSFVSRMRFVVRLPHPSVELRRDIWNRVFPDAVDRDSLDADKLARLPLVGGSIHSIAFHAALQAADEGKPVSMAHLEQAARSEYSKIGKILSPVETRGWVQAPTATNGESVRQ